MKSMKKHNAYMASIPSKRHDPYAAAAAEEEAARAEAARLAAEQEAAALAEAEARREIEKSLGRPVESLFTDLGPAVAAASLAEIPAASSASGSAPRAASTCCSTRANIRNW